MRLFINKIIENHHGYGLEYILFCTKYTYTNSSGGTWTWPYVSDDNPTLWNNPCKLSMSSISLLSQGSLRYIPIGTECVPCDWNITADIRHLVHADCLHLMSLKHICKDNHNDLKTLARRKRANNVLIDPEFWDSTHEKHIFILILGKNLAVTNWLNFVNTFNR